MELAALLEGAEEHSRLRLEGSFGVGGMLAPSLPPGTTRRVGGEGEGLEIEATPEPGPPAGRLIESARGADLLVVGSRGRGGFLGLLLGSVSQQCAQHPPCPLVILPPEDADPA